MPARSSFAASWPLLAGMDERASRLFLDARQAERMSGKKHAADADVLPDKAGASADLHETFAGGKAEMDAEAGDAGAKQGRVAPERRLDPLDPS